MDGVGVHIVQDADAHFFAVCASCAAICPSKAGIEVAAVRFANGQVVAIVPIYSFPIAVFGLVEQRRGNQWICVWH